MKMSQFCIQNAKTFLHEKKKTGYKIPKGWKVFLSFRGVHLDPNNFNDARTFNPWRWQVYIFVSHWHFLILI